MKDSSQRNVLNKASRKDSDIQAQRFKTALFSVVCVFVITLIALVFINGGLVANGAFNAASASNEDDTSYDSGSYVQGVWQSISDGNTVSEALAKEGFVCVYGDKSRASSEKASVPSWFNEEVLDDVSGRDVYATSDLDVVYFTEGGVTSDVESDITAELCGKGWVLCEGNEGDILTFMKKEGECRWLMVQFIGFENETSVVLRIVRN